MNHFALVDQNGNDLFLDNETFRFAENIKRSGISRSTLELKRKQGVLVVLKNHPNMATERFIKYALRNTLTHSIIATGMPKNSIYMNINDAANMRPDSEKVKE